MGKLKFLFLFTLLVYGCTNVHENELLINEMPAPDMQEAEAAAHALTRLESVALAVQQKGTYKISEGEAVQSLERYAKSISGNEEATVRVKSSVLKKSPETGKELYYEVVFESEKGTGFSILSADERADELLCYSEVGAIADTSFNKSLKFCLELVDRYVEEQTRAELDIETLASSAREKISSMNPETKAAPPFNPNTWTYIGQRSELLYYNMRSEYVPEGWHQYTPFNDSLPKIFNQTAPCGSSMVAVAQIMAHHKKPYSNYITTGDWQSIIANPESSVKLKRLMLDLYNNMRAHFTSWSTNSNYTKIRDFLNNNGYTIDIHSSFGGRYEFSDAWNALSYGPAMINGRFGSSSTLFHSWVLAGAIDSKYEHYDLYTYSLNGEEYEYRHNKSWSTPQFLYFRWGEDPSEYPSVDTWFASGVFQADPSLPNYWGIVICSIQ